MKKLIVVVLLMALLALSLSAFQELNPPGTLCEALAWLGTAAMVNVLLGAFVSLLLEYWSAWGSFVPKIKRPIVLGFCLVVPVVSLIGRWALCGALVDQNAIYLAILAGMTAFTGSQFAHIYKLPG